MTSAAPHSTLQLDNIRIDRDAPIATVSLDRPDVFNSLSPALMADLAAALGALDADDEIRAVVLTGGPKFFASGSDIKEMAKVSGVSQLLSERGERWGAVTQFTKPLIAAVNGYVLGGGCELAMMCDLIVAGDTARFGQPEVNLGILPGAGGTQRWPRTAGKYVAMEVAVAAEIISASRAERLGIVNRVVPSEATILVAQRLARKIAAKPPIAVRLAKEAVNRSLETSLTDGLALERRSFHFLYTTDDKAEGMAAFLEKRKPVFRGR